MKKLSSCILDLYPSRESWHTTESRPSLREHCNTWKSDPEVEDFIRLPISDTAISVIDRINYDLKHLSLESRTKPAIPFLNQKGSKICHSSAPDKYIIQQNYSLEMEKQPFLFKEQLKRRASKSKFEPRCSQAWLESVIMEVSSISKHSNYLDLAMEAVTRLLTTILEDLPDNISSEVSQRMNSLTDILGLSYSWVSNILKNSLTIQANLELKRRFAEVKFLRHRYEDFEEHLTISRLFLPVQYQEALELITPEKKEIDSKVIKDKNKAEANRAIFSAGLNQGRQASQGQSQSNRGRSNQPPQGNRSSGPAQNPPRQQSPPKPARGGKGGGGGKQRGGGSQQSSTFRDSRSQQKPKRGGGGNRGSKASRGSRH